jgi:tetratricopeptide (TPR) repeat protein
MTGVLLLAALMAVGEPTAAERFERGCTGYRSGDFEGAVRTWEALVADGYVSAPLHFNLGNARLRLGQRGRAVAAWERALRLEPGDDDARENLAAARRDDPDRALLGEPTLLARLVARVGDRTAVALFVLPWWLLWGALALRRDRGRAARRALTALAIAAALAATAGATLLAGRARDRRFPVAVLVVPTAPVRAGPSAAHAATFELHEGTRIRVVGAQGDFLRARLDGGLEGWIARADLEAL